MDILLINPPYFTSEEMSTRRKEYEHWIRGGNMYIYPFEPPLGLGSLSAYLKEKKFNVELIDMVGLMMEEKELKIILQHKQPPVVGITTMTPTHNDTHQHVVCSKAAKLNTCMHSQLIGNQQCLPTSQRNHAT